MDHTNQNANITQHTFSNLCCLRKFIAHLRLMFIRIKKRQTTLTNFVNIHRIIIKYEMLYTYLQKL